VGFGYTVVAGALSAALRLGILGQSEAQVVLREQWSLLEAAASRARTLAIDEIAAFGPAIEIATMRHERAYSRLFSS
jgi:urease accessory protein